VVEEFKDIPEFCFPGKEQSQIPAGDYARFFVSYSSPQMRLQTFSV
jgi:hypothetical protein